MTARRAGALLLALALVGTTAACGDDDGGQTQAPPSTIDPAELTTTSTTAGSSTTGGAAGVLPPPTAGELEPLYGEQLAALGLQLTNRGGLIDRRGGGYVPSAAGTHLALYVEPVEDRTVPQYIDGIRDVAVVFADIFERWPALESYDVCQEPVDPDGDLGPEPLPVTQIELTRQEAAAIDWATVSVTDLVRASLADPPGLALRVSSEMATDPAYEAIVEEAS